MAQSALPYGPTPTGLGGALDSTELARAPRIEDVLKPDALAELCGSFRGSTGLDVRVLGRTGGTLHAPDAGSAFRKAMAATPRSTELLAADDDALARSEVEASPEEHSGLGGCIYLVGALDYDHETLGTIVVGPYLHDGAEPHGSRVDASSGDGGSEQSADTLDVALGAALAGLPRLSSHRAREHFHHFRTVLDLVLHAGQRARLASTMHMASIQESYRELLAKNAELQTAYERLRELDSLKSAFLATVSHELRTPLTSIIGYSEMLAEGMCGDLTQDQLEFVNTIRQKGDQLLSLIMSLLDLSKLESGTLRMHPVSLGLEPIVEDALSTVRPSATKRGVELVVERAEQTHLVRGDADRLRQVFVNLLDNAVKFTPKGGRVTVELCEEEAMADGEEGLVLLAPTRRVVSVRVRDTGVGIPEHERRRVFDPFYQIDQSSTREVGGAGLGLSIVKRIVEAHQGSIDIEDNEPHGAVFVVSLPVSARSTIPPPPSVAPNSRR
jgi:two-component system, NarL family, sensor histidine kinase BarA